VIPCREGDGDDILFGRGGDDTVSSGRGDDTILGGTGKDSLEGFVGDDLMLGGPGDDTLPGGRGEDVLFGGAGTDYVFGGADDDLLIAGVPGFNTLFGSEGNDILDGRDRSGAFALTPALDDMLDDRLQAAFGDRLSPEQSLRVFDAFRGAGPVAPDGLLGGNGDDLLVGDSGDSPIGGNGADRLVAALGAGAQALQFGPVQMRDFDPAEDLIIVDLSASGLTGPVDVVADGENTVVIGGGTPFALLENTDPVQFTPDNLRILPRAAA
jgi:Ca2+-binding RTX toxin-like protein